MSKRSKSSFSLFGLLIAFLNSSENDPEITPGLKAPIHLK